MALLLPVLALTHRSLKDDDDLAWVIRLTLLVLELAPGARDILRITLGI